VRLPGLTFIEPDRRLWIAEASARMLEIASRSPDIQEVLRAWADEIASAWAPDRIEILLQESERWVRILPKNQRDALPHLAEAALDRAASRREPGFLEADGGVPPRTIGASFSAPEGWRGILLVWRPSKRIPRSRVRLAGDLAEAIGRTVVALRRTESGREEALASERSRWATEVHDGFVQSLLSAKLHTEFCLSLEEEHDEICLSLAQVRERRLRSELTRTRDLLEGTVREVRRFLLELRSPPGSAEEFLPWLHEYAEDYERDTGTAVDVQVEGESHLSKSQAAQAIGLVREALTNVRKHAQASNIHIDVAFVEHGTTISVTDDGVGFDVRGTLERLLDSSRQGLIGLRYRTESIGGILRVHSQPQQGTTLLFRIPRAKGRSTAGTRRTDQVLPPPPPPLPVARHRGTEPDVGDEPAGTESVVSPLQSAARRERH
jgi:signal transduction histidine kinase